MREEFQTIEWAEPPIGDLVGQAVAKGRRMRTAKRLRVGGAGLAVLVVGGLAAIPIVRSTEAPAPAAVVAAAASAAASSSKPTAAASGERVKATPAGMLELLLQNLPKGKTSHNAGITEDGDVSVQTFLDRGNGPGMIRLHVMTRKESDFTSLGTWTSLGNGTKYMTKLVPGNCYQHTIVWVHHPDNTLLQFDLANCPIVDGTRIKQPLTAREAAEVGADPRWGLKIDPELNNKGAAAFPHLSTKFPK
ncbi:hypothetical protein ACIA5C_03425 [Actinoplanes sp. NPDC051343]|uniref:hypothetical protein n=1 Tax=Actinoplanes sp. NPDC051343 TaxID=3363906 RepID=UPI0037911359